MRARARPSWRAARISRSAEYEMYKLLDFCRPDSDTFRQCSSGNLDRREPKS